MRWLITIAGFWNRGPPVNNETFAINFITSPIASRLGHSTEMAITEACAALIKSHKCYQAAELTLETARANGLLAEDYNASEALRLWREIRRDLRATASKLMHFDWDACEDEVRATLLPVIESALKGED